MKLASGKFRVPCAWDEPNNSDQNASAWELYNLRDDIGETENLAALQPDKLQELLAVWHDLNEKMVAPAFR